MNSECVYLIGSPQGSSLVKIGRTANLPERLRSIQSMSPLPLTVLWETPGPAELEVALHERFAKQRKHGEWFDLGSDPVVTVAAAAKDIVAKQGRKRRSSVSGQQVKPQDVAYLDVDDVLNISQIVTRQLGNVRDAGAFAAAVGRPSASMFGIDAYPDLFTKAAALLHSLARDREHAFRDGNKRTAWASTVVFLQINGYVMSSPLDVDRAEQLVLDAAQGLLDVPEIAVALRAFFA